MSFGTFSATNSAIRLNGVLDGFAVCSASTAPAGGPLPNGILDMDLVQITMPALVVGHQDDACPGTPASGVAAVAAGLTSAAPVSQRVFTGGSPPMSQECGPKSPHGYFGIDDQVDLHGGRHAIGSLSHRLEWRRSKARQPLRNALAVREPRVALSME